MAVTAVAAIAAAGLGAYKAIKSASDKKKAKAASARLQQPIYQVQNEYLQNKNLALANAGQGYTSGAKDYLTSEAERGFGTGISAISSSGGSANDYAKLYSGFLRSVDSTAANDSQLQLGNIQRLMDANKEVAGQRTIGWSLNQDRPYQTKRKEYRQDQQIADANMWEGINTGIGAISAYGTSRLNAKMIPTNNPNNVSDMQGGGGFIRQPAQTVNSQQPINPVLQMRSSPNVDLSSNGPYGGGGGYYPGSADNDWQNALNLNYN